MPDREPIPEGWIDITHPDGSGEVARVTSEGFDAIYTHKGWVDVDTAKGKELTGGEHAPLDPLLEGESDEVKRSARKATAKSEKSTTTTTGGSS